MAESRSTQYACPLCIRFCGCLKNYVGHLRVSHGKERSFHVMCGVSGCREVFRTFSAFNSHIYRHHRVEIGIVPSDSGTPGINHPMEPDLISQSTSCTNDQEVEVFDFDVPSPGKDATPVSPQTISGSMEAAKMLLKLREGHQVSQAALGDVISSCRLLCTQALKSFRTDIVASLGSSVEGKISEIDLDCYDPFQHIDSNYLFEKFCTENLGCLVSSHCTKLIYSVYNGSYFCTGSP